MSQYKKYYTVYKDKDWEMFPQIHQGVINSWQILERFLTEEEIVVYSNGWNPLSSKPQIKTIKEYHSKKREASKEEAPVGSTSKPQVNQPPKEGKILHECLDSVAAGHLSEDRTLERVKTFSWWPNWKKDVSEY
ncbi:hypothetical protein O181_081805 [Austropuccinia psidii MF-1]|uniref:Integrase zinc-binding domain-containing protein n=1 Tax=Austropuccinia psidii MF-1 TaxID=1389203 RepID=A0A9Q3FQP8_9BASI|nr:hypothetical protein [Austropuccinia psidii MF-1]